MKIEQMIPSVRSGRHAGLFHFLLFIGGYAALLGWFKFVDVYHSHFSDPGVLVLFNNLFRVLFIFYLFWIVQATGAVLLRLVVGLRAGEIDPLEYVALTFFAGTGPWHAVLLAVGFANLLNAPVMMIVTAPMVALSFRELRLVTPGLRAAFADRLKAGGNLFKAACILLGVVWCVLLLVKGVYPGGGQDYFVQYSPVYQAIVAHGGVWPNEVWWHYFYSRGAGLFFLGILLTDPLAPHLVTFCLLSVAGLAVFVFIRGFAPGTAWPMAGIVLFFGTYIYTPGWGEFGKLHEFNTAFVIAILWMTTVALGEAGSTRRAWLAGTASAMIAAITVNNTIAVFLGAVFGVLALASAGMGERRHGLVCLALSALAGALYSGNLLINFLTSGLLTGWDPSFLFFWRFADLEKLNRWGALPSALVLSQFFAGQGVPLGKAINFLNFSSRSYLLWPVFFGGLGIAAISAYARYRAGRIDKRHEPASPPHAGEGHARLRNGTGRVSDATLVLLAAIVVFAMLTVTTGRSWSTGSYYRLASFMVPVVIVAGIAMWTAPLRHDVTPSLAAVVGHPGTPIAVLMLCAIVMADKTRIDRNIVPLGVNALKYAAGVLSIDGAYTHQSGGHSIGPWGGIYPGARGAYGMVGPHVPIWSMHAETYCMLPDCKMMSFPHFIMSRSWERVMWGTPEEGEKALRAAGLNYFLFSRELPIRDPLFFSPLFSPDGIARHLGIRWTDGTTILLTWSGPDTTALDEIWLADYRQAVAATPWRNFRSARMKAMFERLNATPHPWRSVDLPWLRP